METAHPDPENRLGGRADLDSRVLRADGTVFSGLLRRQAAAAGFGGGGVRAATRSLEGTFTPRRLRVFSGRAAGRAAAGNTA